MAIYTVLMHEGTSTRFAVYKTTGNPNDQGTWAVVASSDITLTNEIFSLWAVKDGTHIHIVTQEAVTGRVAYHDFNTGSDTYTTNNEQVDAATSATDDEMGCSIALRSDGDVIVIYSEASATGVQWARREATVWTLADLGGTDTHAGVLVLGSSDRIHALYVDNVSTEVQSRTIRSDNTLSTETQAHPDVDQLHGVGPGVSYDDGGTQRCRVPVEDSVSSDVNVIEFDSADSPTFADSGDITTTTVKIVNNTVITTLSVDQKNLQLLFIDDSSSDLFRDQNDDDAGWGTDEEILDAVSIDGLSANVVTIGGLVVLAHLLHDSATGLVTYRDIVLRVVTASTFANARLPQQHYYVGPFKNGSDYYTVEVIS